MEYQRLIIRGISYSQNQSGAYALLLEHEPTQVKLPIVIGGFEAQAITLGLEKDLKPMRPLTHDLFGNFIKESQYTLQHILIYQILEGVFFSNLYFKNKVTEEELTLDARTSDAVAIAVRFNAPIYTTQNVLEEAGILLDDDLESEISEEELEELTSEEKHIPVENSLGILTEEELENLLEQAVEEEDFDVAVEIQQEIQRRNKK